MANTDSTVHLWDDETFRVTVCGLVKEVVLRPRTMSRGGTVTLCKDCHYIGIGNPNALPILKAPPSPGEQALLDYFFPNA